MSEKVYTWLEAFKEVLSLGHTLGYLFSRGRKEYREQLIASIFTCAMTKNLSAEWRLKIIETEDTPDFELWRTEQPQLVYKIENTQIPSNVLKADRNVSEQVYNFLIKKKLNPKKYKYPSSYILCVYLRFNATIDIKFLRKKFSEYEPKFGQIWFISRNDFGTRWRCTEIWWANKGTPPQYQDFTICLNDELKPYGLKLTMGRLKS